MIISAAFVPSAPLLVPDVAQGATSELDDVRAASLRAIASATEGADRVVLVGAGSIARMLASGTGSFRGFGVPLEVALDPAAGGGEPLPLSLSVGAWLLVEAGWDGARAALEVGPESSDAEIDAAGAALAAEEPRTALMVVADGSNSRTEKAPGFLKADAEPFDAEVAKALAAGDPSLLAAVDRDRATSVGSAGRPAWRAAAAALGGSTYDAELLIDEAPYGVGYLVATWRR